MIGLIYLYFIGRYFYRLAFEHDKKEWPWAIAGVASYYIGTFIGGIILFIFASMFFPDSTIFTIESRENELLLGVLAIPFGLLGCYALSRGLKYYWTKEGTTHDGNLDSEMINKHNEY